MATSRTEAEAPVDAGTLTTQCGQHTRDEDCVPYLTDDGSMCSVCWVGVGEPCRYCGATSYHAPACPTQLDPPAWMSRESLPDFCNACRHAGFTFLTSERTGGAVCPKCGSYDVEENVEP